MTTVPSEEAAEAAWAMRDMAMKHTHAVTSQGELVVFDDEPTPLGEAEILRDERGLPQAGQPIPSDLILFPRSVYYHLAGLMLVLAGVCFAAGYFIGRGNANFDLMAIQRDQARQKVLIEGLVVYQPSAGANKPDSGAAVILLPSMSIVEAYDDEDKISIVGLRPDDVEPTDIMPSIKRLTEIGGYYRRTDEQGKFFIHLPDTGKFELLVISHAATAAPDFDMDEVVELSIERYFSSTRDLIGRKKFRWQTIEPTPMMGSVEINFGESGKAE